MCSIDSNNNITGYDGYLMNFLGHDAVEKISRCSFIDGCTLKNKAVKEMKLFYGFLLLFFPV